ncbi:MAG: glutathione S-transferase family protein [Proteobacteria bacterium]|nr:glutathione S-transferase family protein [Pseudomonadota bacterium]
MGLLIDGKWHDQWYDTQKTKGEFVREQSQFRNWITIDGQPGPTGKGGFKAQSGRYHLYVSYACPWAHRALIFRALKDLNEHISVNIVHPHMLENGWSFDKQDPFLHDTLHHSQYLYEVYLKANPHFTGRVTVPVLWDKEQSTIVNNESAEIIRMFNSAFNDITGNQADFYPKALQTKIDTINQFVYENINNGVYRCGFATTQDAYDKAFDKLFNAIEEIENTLATNQYLVGDTITEADWRLFTTLIRFDAVYYSHFKCNLRRMKDYPNLSRYLEELFLYPGIKQTVHFDHIKHHYYFSQKQINPTQIIPKGPLLDF